MAWQDTYAAQIGSWTADYVPAAVLEAMSSSHVLGIFFYMATEPALHIWMGVNDIPAGIDGVTPDGTVFLGGGRLLNIPSLEVLCNGQSGSVSFGISGIDPATAAEVLAAMPPVRGKKVMIALTTLDQYYQPTASLIPVWSGTASHPTEESGVVPGDANPTVSLSLAVISGNNTRSRASGSLWSSAHQKADYPTDRGCDQASRIARGVAPTWP
jgi:hypothetical protein